MNVKLLLGTAIFLVGVIAAVVAIVQVGQGDASTPLVAAESNPFGSRFLKFAVPAIAGLSLTVGGLLMALGIGNWKRPRTHLEPGDAVVDPEGYHKMKHV